ncbi:MAG: tetratricopeptide repeat protein [Terriglobales bacterium]
MRRFAFVLPLLAFLLVSAYASQRASRPLTNEGLRTAQIPRRYEPPSSTATVAELETRGDEFRAEKAYGDAIDYYRTALGRGADKKVQATIYNKIGIAELQLQHLKEAQKNFERALKLNPTLAEARNNVGAAHYLRKKYGKAIKQYRKALELQPDNASFHSNIATAYFADKKYSQALAEYRQALTLDPTVLERNSQTGVSAQISSPENRAQYHYLLAKLYAETGNFDRSIECLKKAMEDGYKDIDAVYKDVEFAALRKDPRFTALMAQKPVAIPE